MAMDAAAALAAIAALRGDPQAAARVLADFAPVAGRGARRALTLPNGSALLLDESYNANPASVRAALSVLRLQPGARRIAVLGDMLELGEAAVPEHGALAQPVTEAADTVFACGPLMRNMYDRLPAEARAGYAADAAALVAAVAASLRPGDVILIKGSLGMRMRQIVAALDALAAPAGLA